MNRIVVLTGAGVSAESGIPTFRDGDGLWKKYRFEELATPAAFSRNPELVLEFYNWRRKIVMDSSPNPAHLALKKLESGFDVQIITQNVDDLHERAGSLNVMHLHGEIRKSRSTVDENLVYPIEGAELNMGDVCAKGSQLRPHIVWFGEQVNMIGPAMDLVRTADILMVIGTSLVVYPAAGLIVYASPDKPKYYIDPKAFAVGGISNLEVISEPAGIGVPRLVDQLLAAK
jgi:NAD-dependent deacetylase